MARQVLPDKSTTYVVLGGGFGPLSFYLDFVRFQRYITYVSTLIAELIVSHVIYKIRNVVNNKFYVGSTIHKKVRFREHRKQLRKGRHHCKHLQAAWNKYGEECFKFEVVEEVSSDKSLVAAENIWLSQHVGEAYCYNSGRSADAPWRGGEKEKHPRFGKTLDPEQRAQISASLKAYYAADPYNHPRLGCLHSEETKAKISAARKGKMVGEEHYRYGKTVPDDVRKKIGDAQRGVAKKPRKVSAEGMRKIKAAALAGHYSHQKGKKLSLEEREKRSKQVFVMPDGILFPSLTKVLHHYKLKMPTLRRALKSGMPITKGKLKGYEFKYYDKGSFTDQDNEQ